MPFGGWFDDYYTQIYSPAIKDSGLQPRRADDLYRPGTIINDIWSYTKNSKIVLADLTGKNPNVLYELGLAHALAKPVILLAESLEDIPFDLRALRIIEYDKNAPNWSDQLRGKISSAIKEVLDAPLSAVLPTFLEIDETKSTRKITAYDEAYINFIEHLNNAIARYRGYYSKLSSERKYTEVGVREMINEVSKSRMKLLFVCGKHVKSFLDELGTEWLNDMKSFYEKAPSIVQTLPEIAYKDRT